MNTILIGYDLNKKGQNYETLISEIKKLGTWWHCLDSTWLIKSNATPVSILEKLKQFIDSNDELFITQIYNNSAWIGFNKECSDWLRQNL
ncbi:hypothetical protein SAMN05421788_102358 [Filimonas lacunae]|uniref:SinR family protein n=1 Tax=Filimonas lacunae TaxID=477680 RepID=A0A1N7NDD6_9BACT|nr:SinR family protein [Filimonas lacunae]SIS96377.1 hypothetical protein SAMN05421788_102358 [Filimonas lacunae]